MQQARAHRCRELPWPLFAKGRCMSQAATARRQARVPGLVAGALAIACSVALAQPPAAPADAAWQHGLSWRGQNVEMADGGQGYVLSGAARPRTIPAQPLRSQTASPLFDGLFALAQLEVQ